MKSPNSIPSLLALTLLAGCATSTPNVPVSVLREMPAYPEAVGYDTSAKLFVPRMIGVERMGSALVRNLRTSGYALYTDDAFNTSTPVPPDFVVTPLRWYGTTERYNGDTVVYVRCIVQVRRPAVLNENKTVASFGEKPRDFQAISRQIIGKRLATQLDWNRGIDAAMVNMLKNPAFRQALQQKPAETRSDRFGFDMTIKTPAPQ